MSTRTCASKRTMKILWYSSWIMRIWRSERLTARVGIIHLPGHSIEHTKLINLHINCFYQWSRVPFGWKGIESLCLSVRSERMKRNQNLSDHFQFGRLFSSHTHTHTHICNTEYTHNYIRCLERTAMLCYVVPTWMFIWQHSANDCVLSTFILYPLLFSLMRRMNAWMGCHCLC